MKLLGYEKEKDKLQCDTHAIVLIWIYCALLSAVKVSSRISELPIYDAALKGYYAIYAMYILIALRKLFLYRELIDFKIEYMQLI